MPAKDFAPIENDYAFFATHADEAENDSSAYASALADLADGRSDLRMIDFGCGTGEFTERLLTKLAWPPEGLQLGLVEPVEHQRAEAVRRLARFSRGEIAAATSLTGLAAQGPFDVLLSNHALYYVNDIEATLRQFIAALADGGRMLTAIADWDNVLVDLWTQGFGILGQPVPYYAATDVAQGLSKLGVPFGRTKVPYRLRFADSVDNRLKILRFLFAEHLADSIRAPLLAQFDRYRDEGQIDINTHSYHFAVELT
jgi:trans-aconitate 2-methyltransferase